MEIAQIVILGMGIILSIVGLKESLYYFGSGTFEDPQNGKSLLFSAVRSIAVTLWGFAFILSALIIHALL